MMKAEFQENKYVFLDLLLLFQLDPALKFKGQNIAFLFITLSKCDEK